MEITQCAESFLFAATKDLIFESFPPPHCQPRLGLVQGTMPFTCSQEYMAKVIQNSAPAQPRLQHAQVLQAHSNTIIVLASMILQSKHLCLLQATPYQRAAQRAERARRRCREGGKAVSFWLGDCFCAVFLIAKTHAAWSSAVGTAVTPTIRCCEGWTAGLTGCCCQNTQCLSTPPLLTESVH